PAYTFAAGGVFTSIHDLAAFLQGIASGRLLDRALAERMFEPTRLASGKSAGFAVGWTQATYRGLREVGHSGGPALADVRYYPDQKLGVVVLASQRNLMPVLARGVAGMYLQSASYLNEQGMPDNSPAHTATVKRVLEQFTAGKADPALFAGGMKGALKELDNLLSLQLGALPPMTRLVLLDSAPDNSVRTYRAIHGKGDSLRWVFHFSPDGLVTDLDTVDE
ncbi:MAG TPA: serine hydrolase, partial [Telluria sp.]|nr:serine hydrolase [Telluria sp.]